MCATSAWCWRTDSTSTPIPRIPQGGCVTSERLQMPGAVADVAATLCLSVGFLVPKFLFIATWRSRVTDYKPHIGKIHAATVHNRGARPSHDCTLPFVVRCLQFSHVQRAITRPCKLCPSDQRASSLCSMLEAHTETFYVSGHNSEQ